MAHAWGARVRSNLMAMERAATVMRLNEPATFRELADPSDIWARHGELRLAPGKSPVCEASMASAPQLSASPSRILAPPFAPACNLTSKARGISFAPPEHASHKPIS